MCIKCSFITCTLPISLEHLKLRKRKITDIILHTGYYEFKDSDTNVMTIQVHPYSLCVVGRGGVKCSFITCTLPISLGHLKLRKMKITNIILHAGYYEFKKDLDANDMTVQIQPYSLFEWGGTRGVCVKCIFIICPLPISLEHLKLRKRKVTDIWRMMKHIKHEMYPTCPCESQQSVYAALQWAMSRSRQQLLQWSSIL